MNVFMAAVYTNGYMKGQARYGKLTPHEQSLTDAIPHILESWHYVGKQKYVDEMRADAAQIFLDSGAFSAYTLGVELRVSDYCNYIERNRDIIRIEDGSLMASVLDGIGDPLQTYRNQLEMEARGVRPLPCFHSGEDEKYLEWYVENYDYITLGGMVGASTKQLCIWLDRIWDRYLVDGAGNPKIKVHGFGITAVPIMERYPWFSCDSSSWIQSAAFGSVVMPTIGPLSVSEKSPARHDAGQHLCNLTPIEQDNILRYLEENGFTFDRLATVYESRAAFNLWAYGVINVMINANHNNRLNERIQELF
ncbi:queuosine tRNA ribosyltransferase [Pantoea phage vB_PagS_Vid5]|uniref:Queuosine tRNA ribosyltransferase n=1 Tax=Pantoea phage vB_PagS_Vid5 TaxID=2099652 RepID=A0A2P1CKQ7_9CAUD|nr:queuine tRNA-ribosyltransferase [Pantoea phage vB_PagS_Vid5]AVJ51789.1 queuosine tRNA ribosyltransferase [Pantoea phage vB_PagS_Vid5]